MKPFARLGVLAAVLLLGLIATPATHAASSISSIDLINGELVVDRTAVISVNGVLDPADHSPVSSLTVGVNPAGVVCGISEKLNRSSSIDDLSHVFIGPGPTAQLHLNWTPKRAGEFTLCAYLGLSETPVAQASIPVTVREPRVSLVLTLPGNRFEPGGQAPITVTATAEVARKVWVTRNSIGVPCGVNRGVNNGLTVLSDFTVLGDQTPSMHNIPVGSLGQYHLCGYVDQGYGDASPNLVIDGPSYSAGKPPVAPSCKVKPKTVKRKTQFSISCVGGVSQVTITAKQGKRTTTRIRNLTASKLTIKGRMLGLRRGRGKATVTVFNRAAPRQQLGMRTKVRIR